MLRSLRNLNAFIKGLVLLLRPHLWLGWLRHPMLTISNVVSLSRWIGAQDTKGILNDFYTPKRDHAKRYKLYQYLVDQKNLVDSTLDYYEFGVSQGHSIRWWLAANRNPHSRFYGFDTFEGLPEKWGTYQKGDMAAGIPDTDDRRVSFVAGLFQNSLPPFLAGHEMYKDRPRIFQLDADLFSSTLFVLSSLAPYLQKGDILLFDEFNVPNHEFFAFRIFSDSYYIRTRLLGAVNNYYQVALEIT